MRSVHTEKEDRLLRAELKAGEDVLARGLASEARGPSLHLGTGNDDYLLVTSLHLLWVPRGRPDWKAILEFDDVAAWAEGTQNHRYVLALTHRPIERLAHAPEHRVLWWKWGDTEELRRQEESTFVFSRRDTDAAVAIRKQIARREVKALDPLEFEEVPRVERVEGAVLEAQPRWRARLEHAWLSNRFHR